jgi:pyruvate,orthophosphate dikinase
MKMGVDMADKMIYLFGEGDTKNKNLLGNKGACLGEMGRIGLPVPPGFTIVTPICIEVNKSGRLTDDLLKEIEKAISSIEQKTGKKFGDGTNPLLLSVRSGSAASMPGMMDTILNLGLNENTTAGLAKKTGDERFALDCYRRFIQMFSNVVLGAEHEKFEKILEKYKKGKQDTDLTPADLRMIIKDYKSLVEKETGKPFADEPKKQLIMSILAVFNSWNNKRAKTYRKINRIPENMGTAVNIQTMVFGNMGWDSGTGVGFTRNPSTGKKEKYGEFLFNAQGEDVVAGIRTPQPVEEMKKKMPGVYSQLSEIYEKLEKHFRDMQDFEFTIEKGKLYILQTRNGKRTAQAAVKIAVDMVNEGLITKEEALLRVDPNSINQLLHERLDPNAKYEVIAKGLAASPGAGTGKVVFTADDAVKMKEEGDDVILVRNETSPEDIHGMHASKGILTARGGMTSHAAVVARGMGKPCVSGCESISVDLKNKSFSAGGRKITEGEYITIDGGMGHVILGKISTVEPSISGEFREFMEWADKAKVLGVRTNAETPKDAQTARDFGAEGIGLCRTEHMFFAEDRLPWMRRMIMAKNREERKESLDRMMAMQKEDFASLFRIMSGLPITIRLLDPPLHEFLPSHEELLVEITKMKERKQNSEENEKMLKIVENLREVNPMLGNRGCRLGITMPEIYEMQVRAIIEAACDIRKKGITVAPEIMIPLVSHVNELKMMREMTIRVASDVIKKYGIDIKYKVGTMIELPRACVTADEIASEADFFSFGTNDLTQTAFGFSRDDAEGKFLNKYKEIGIFEEDPFEVLDRAGVGNLVKTAVHLGRSKRKDLKVGICGEHGGEPKSVEFCHSIGLDYVSCSPFRVPIARLAAAQAAIRGRMPKN